MFKVGDIVKYTWTGDEYTITKIDPISEMYTLTPLTQTMWYYGDFYRSKSEMEAGYTLVSASVPEKICECGIWKTCGKDWPKNRHSRWCQVYEELK